MEQTDHLKYSPDWGFDHLKYSTRSRLGNGAMINLSVPPLFTPERNKSLKISIQSGHGLMATQIGCWGLGGTGVRLFQVVMNLHVKKERLVVSMTPENRLFKEYFFTVGKINETLLR